MYKKRRNEKQEKEVIKVMEDFARYMTQLDEMSDEENALGSQLLTEYLELRNSDKDEAEQVAKYLASNIGLICFCEKSPDYEILNGGVWVKDNELFDGFKDLYYTIITKIH